MQTFLPYKDFEQTAKCLDRARLGKQRVECLQIMKALTDKDYGWQNHPIVKMWKGFEHLLLEYSRQICLEWTDRGYKDTCFSKITQVYYTDLFKEENQEKFNKFENTTPCWLGDEELHNSHKSNLLRKNKEHYKKFNWSVNDNLDYKWYA